MFNNQQINLVSQLFDLPSDPTKNLLPKEGTVLYFGKVFNSNVADDYYQNLLKNIEWRNDEAIMFGKHIITKRKVAWYADKPYEYSYSNTIKKALSWTNELTTLKAKAEELTCHSYNSCLLNLYHNGSEGMAYHSDDEKDLKPNGAIASFSFGAERKLAFRHKTDDVTISQVLEHGSLLVMKDETQTFWKHRLPPTKKVNTPRVNLTFRSMLE